jgi:Icc-related predicted phosphoesterase
MKILAIGDFHGKFPEKLKKEANKADLIISLGDYAGIEEWRPYLNYCFKFWSKGKRPLKTSKEFFGKNKFKKLLREDDGAGRFVLKELDKLNKPVLFIFGNGDDAFYNYPFDDFFYATKANLKFIKKLNVLKNITYSKTKIKGVNFIGFGGFMDASANHDKKPKTVDERERFEMMQERNNMAKKKFENIIRGVKGEEIFVLHYPPKGIFDKIIDKKNPYHGKSAGVGFFREKIIKHKPRLVLCGHMHEYQGKKNLGKSLIVNPGAAFQGKAAVIEWPSLDVKFIK